MLNRKKGESKGIVIAISQGTTCICVKYQTHTFLFYYLALKSTYGLLSIGCFLNKNKDVNIFLPFEVYNFNDL